jgi:ribonuclease R
MKKKKQTKPTATRKRSNGHSKTVSVQGTLDISRHGMGYVMVPGMETDIIVKRENLKNAMHGDTVEVAIIKVGPTSKRPEGLITKIVKRGQSELIGTVQLKSFYAFVVPDNKSFTKDIFINEQHSKGLKNGDRVIAKITDWSDKLKNPEGIITEILNDERVNEIAMKEILLKQGFTLEFPEEVLRETAALPTELDEYEISKRLDLRKLHTITIDPHDAKDFDDAISFRKLENGNLEVGVHIADVSHYVKPNTALDKEAFDRATSVYLPDRVLPMLPEKISNELCSLRPHEDKFTFSAIFEMNEKAEVLKYTLAKTVIHSDRRFTYEEAQEIIDGKSDTHQEIILTLHKLSQQLRQRKFEAGAINFSSEEARFILDEHGIPTSVVVKESNESHQLIEELMLLANRTVAEYVASKKVKNQAIPFPYRIHDSPDLDKLKPFAAFAASFGHKFNLSSPEKISASFNAMITNTGHHPEDAILHTLGIRTMAKAVYATENIGHYGLAFEFYCHFTSPIRRYPDVLVHRIVEQCLENNIVPTANMDDLCKHSSEKERKAMEAEREGNKYKQVEFMRKHLGEEFEAVISGVANFGFWAQTIEHRCEGFVSTLEFDDAANFKFIDEEYALVNKRSGKKYQIGKSVKIKVLAANLEKKQIDFGIVED